MQHIESAHPLVTRDDIGGSIPFGVANVQTCATRIGKHVEDVKFRLRGIETFFIGIGRMKKLLLFPDGLPFWFELIEWVRFAALVHGSTTNGHE
jgi:hypothetical protein